MRLGPARQVGSGRDRCGAVRHGEAWQVRIDKVGRGVVRWDMAGLVWNGRYGQVRHGGVTQVLQGVMGSGAIRRG
jgi:hypothetical protein